MKEKKRKIAASPAVWLAGLAVLCLFFPVVANNFNVDANAGGASLREEFLINVGNEVKNALYGQFVPQLCILGENAADFGMLKKQLHDLMPFFQYAMVSGNALQGAEEKSAFDEQELLSMEELGAAEYEEASEMWEEASDAAAENTVEENLEEGAKVDDEGQDLQALLQAENEAAMQAAGNVSEFVPHTLQNPIAPEALSNYETLVQDFYTIDANTMAGKDQLNAELLLHKDLTITKEEGPQILIFHTHSQETFADSVPGDTATSIVGVGEHLSSILTEKYGYEVLHHEGQYDVDSRDDAYSRALPDVKQVLSDNPSIQVVIDLHRDQMPPETKLLVDLDGRPTAKFMFFNGLSRTRKTGDIAYLKNENQEDNLAFSFQMQYMAAQYYPGLTRKIYLKGYRYNMHLKSRYLLVELGAQNNTVEEAMNACEPLAHLLDLVLDNDS